MTELSPVFKVKLTDAPDDLDSIDKKNYEVTLASVLAGYTGSLQYDAGGNANLTIVHKRDGEVVLDFCLDNGEINQIGGELLEGLRG